MAITFRAVTHRPTEHRESAAQADQWTPFEKPVADAFVQAVQAHQSHIVLDDLVTALARRDIPAVINALGFPGLDARLQILLTAPLLEAYEAGGDYGYSKIKPRHRPKLTVIKAELSGVFGVTNEKATQYAQEQVGTLITQISADQLQSVRNIIGGLGFAAGQPVDALAKQIAGSVGLNAPQQAALGKYSDQQWANTLANKPSQMTPALQKKIDATQGRIDGYEQRLLRQRGEMIARTEVIRAETQGQLEVWGEGMSQGFVAQDAEKVWVTTGGACEECEAMTQESVPVKGNFSNGAPGPPAHPNCRCDISLAAAKAGINMAGIQGGYHEDLAAKEAVAEEGRAFYDAQAQSLWEKGLVTEDEMVAARNMLDSGKLPAMLGGHDTFAYETEIVPDTGKWILRNVVTGEPRGSAKGIPYSYATEKAALADAARQGSTVGGKLLEKPLAGKVTTFDKLTLKQVQAMDKIAGPSGSNPGQWYKDPATGKEYYLKQSPSPTYAQNEVASGKVYEALGAKPGVDIPRLKAFEDISSPVNLSGYVLSEKIDGLQALYGSTWVDGMVPGMPNEGAVLVSRVAEMHASAAKLWAGDALTSNWDVVGQNYDNLFMVRNADGTFSIARVDTGGAGAYRAQGGLKGGAWTDTTSWTDPWTMRGGTKGGVSGSEQGKTVFGQITDKEAQSLLKQAATKLTPARLATLEKSMQTAGVSKQASSSYMTVIKERLASVPQVVQDLKPIKPTVYTAKGAFKVAPDAEFRLVASSKTDFNMAQNHKQIEEGLKNFSDPMKSGVVGLKDVILDYKGGESLDINRFARDDPRRVMSNDPEQRAAIKILDEGMKVNGALNNVILHSGQSQEAEYMNWTEKKTWVNRNYWSTSIGDRAGFSSHDVQVHIEVPKGASAMFVQHIDGFADERETITPRGMTLLFQKITRYSSGQPKEVWARYVEITKVELPGERVMTPLARATDRLAAYLGSPEIPTVAKLEALKGAGAISAAEKDLLMPASAAKEASLIAEQAKVGTGPSLSHGMQQHIEAIYGHVPTQQEIAASWVKGDVLMADVQKWTGQSASYLVQYVSDHPALAAKPLWTETMGPGEILTPAGTTIKMPPALQAQYVNPVDGTVPTMKGVLHDYNIVGSLTTKDVLKLTGKTPEDLQLWVTGHPTEALKPIWTPAAELPPLYVGGAGDATAPIHYVEQAAMLTPGEKANYESIFGHPPTVADLAQGLDAGKITTADQIKITGFAGMGSYVTQFPEKASLPLWDAPKEVALAPAGAAYKEGVVTDYFGGKVPSLVEIQIAYLAGKLPYDVVDKLTGMSTVQVAQAVTANPTAASKPLWAAKILNENYPGATAALDATTYATLTQLAGKTVVDAEDLLNLLAHGKVSALFIKNLTGMDPSAIETFSQSSFAVNHALVQKPLWTHPWTA